MNGAGFALHHTATQLDQLLRQLVASTEIVNYYDTVWDHVRGGPDESDPTIIQANVEHLFGLLCPYAELDRRCRKPKANSNACRFEICSVYKENLICPSRQICLEPLPYHDNKIHIMPSCSDYMNESCRSLHCAFVHDEIDPRFTVMRSGHASRRHDRDMERLNHTISRGDVALLDRMSETYPRDLRWERNDRIQWAEACASGNRARRPDSYRPRQRDRRSVSPERGDYLVDSYRRRGRLHCPNCDGNHNEFGCPESLSNATTVQANGYRDYFRRSYGYWEHGRGRG